MSHWAKRKELYRVNTVHIMRADHRQTYSKACLSERYSSFLHSSSKTSWENCSNRKVNIPLSSTVHHYRTSHTLCNQSITKKNPVYEKKNCLCLAKQYWDKRSTHYFSIRLCCSQTLWWLFAWHKREGEREKARVENKNYILSLWEIWASDLKNFHLCLGG